MKSVLLETLLSILVVSTPLSFPSPAGMPDSETPETLIVNSDFNGREIKLRSGATLQVELKQAGATGYEWQIQELDLDHFKILSVKTEDREGSGALVGAPLMKIWKIRATKAGKSKLTFLYYRSWEGEKSAADTFTLNVRILETN